jgi:hypothetical protein
LFEALQSFKAKRLGSCGVATTVVRDDVCRRLERPVRRGKGKIGEERAVAVARVEIPDQTVGERVRRIERLRQRTDEVTVLGVKPRRNLQQTGFCVGLRLVAEVVGSTGQESEGPFKAVRELGSGRR